MKRTLTLVAAALLPVAAVSACGSESGTPRPEGFTEIVLPIEVSTATGVAVNSDGDVFVADAGAGNTVERSGGGFGATSGRIVRLDADATSQTDVATEVGGLVALALAPDGTMYAVDNSGGRIVTIAPGDGEQSVVPFDLESSFPDDVAVDADGGVYVLDDERVLYLPAGSTEQSVLPFDDAGDPTRIAVTATGDVYLLDGGYSDGPSVWRLVKGQDNPEKVPLAGATEPQDIAVDADGDMYVLDSAGGGAGNAVLRYPQGETEPVATPFTLACGQSRLDLAVGDNGDIFIADGSRVSRLTEEAVDTPAAENATDGAYEQSTLPFTLDSTAADIAYTADGRLYVADIGAGSAISPNGYTLGGGNGRILVLEPGADMPTVVTSSVPTPVALSVAADGALYANDWFDRVVAVTDGSAEPTALPFELPEDGSIRGVAAAANGDVYAFVGDDEYALQIVRAGSPTAEKVAVTVENVKDMALADNGNLYVLDTYSDVIWKVEPGAAQAEKMRYSDDMRPVSLTAGPDDTLYLVDAGTGTTGAAILEFEFGAQQSSTVTTFAPSCRTGEHDLVVADDSTIYVTDDTRVLELTKP